MQIDHIELFVPDRDAAVSWYGEWLGFQAMPEHAEWAADGPLMMTNDSGRSMLALFVGEAAGEREVAGWRRVAFRTDADSFWSFAERYRQSGQPIEGPVDHQKSWSVYFSDPWGNALEVTTYNYSAVSMIMHD